MRAITSVPPPAGKPTMMWTGFLITCARATGISGAMTATPQPATIMRRVSIGATPGDGAIMRCCYRYQVRQTRESRRRPGRSCPAAEDGVPTRRVLESCKLLFHKFRLAERSPTRRASAPTPPRRRRRRGEVLLRPRGDARVGSPNASSPEAVDLGGIVDQDAVAHG